MHDITHYCTTVCIHLQALFLNSFFVMKTSLEKDIFNEMIVAHEIPFHMIPKLMGLHIKWLGYLFHFPWPCFTNTESILYTSIWRSIAQLLKELTCINMSDFYNSNTEVGLCHEKDKGSVFPTIYSMGMDCEEGTKYSCFKSWSWYSQLLSAWSSKVANKLLAHLCGSNGHVGYYFQSPS